MTKKNLALAIIWLVTEFRESYKRLQNQMTAGLPAQKEGFAAACPGAPRAVAASPKEIARWTVKLMKQRERARLGQ